MIYVLIYGLFAACCIPFCIRKKDVETYLDKASTDWIRGITILIIMIHHCVQRYDGFQFLYPFQTLGYGAVAAFLLLSGYGLGVQYQRKINYLNGFLKNKVLRLYITFWCAYLVMYTVSVWNGNPVPLEKVITNLVTMSIIDTPTWYIKVQTGLYILFFLIFRLKIEEKRKKIMLFAICGMYTIVCVLLHVKQYWWFTIIWFPLGVLLSYMKKRVVEWLEKYWGLHIVLNMTVLMASVVLRFFKGNMSYPLLMDIVITVSFVLLILALVCRVEFLFKPVQYIGGASLELYLIHSMLLTGYMGKYTVDSIATYVTYLGVSIGLSFVVKYFSNGISKLLNNKK